jgi:hypothetical protein
MGKSATESFRGRTLEVLERVVDAADVEIGMTAHDLVRTSPQSLVGHQPLAVGFAHLGHFIHANKYAATTAG